MSAQSRAAAKQAISRMGRVKVITGYLKNDILTKLKRELQ
jgi:hypothetical protein